MFGGPQAVFELEHMGLPFSELKMVESIEAGGQSKDFGKGGQLLELVQQRTNRPCAFAHSLSG